MPLLEKHFAEWKADGPAPAVPALATVAVPQGQRVFLVDQPGAIQANILAGQLVAPTQDPRSIEFDVANGVLGGTFSSRLNMNLREDKSWSYGSYSFVPAALGQRPWIVSAPVQIDRTVDSIAEIKRELREFTGARPASAEEVEKIKARNVRAMPGSFESAGAVLGQVSGILRYKRPDDWPLQYQALQEAMTLDQVRSAAGVIQPDALTWVIVGDLSKIEQPVRELFGASVPVQVLDADGEVVE
jgi:predicted Zn-dependent peptidase